MFGIWLYLRGIVFVFCYYFHSSLIINYEALTPENDMLIYRYVIPCVRVGDRTRFFIRSSDAIFINLLWKVGNIMNCVYGIIPKFCSYMKSGKHTCKLLNTERGIKTNTSDADTW